MRTAISRSRAAARASKRFARLAQAINSTSSTAPLNTSSAGRRSPVMRRCSGRGQNPHAVEESGRFEILRVFGPNARRQLRQLRLELLVGERRLQPGEYVHHPHGAHCGARALPRFVHRQGTPDLGSLGIVEALRHHADDGVRQAVERQRLAHGVRIGAQAAAPEGIADHHDCRRCRALPRPAPDSAPSWARAQHGKEGRRHLGGVQLFGLFTAAPVRASAGRTRQPRRRRAAPRAGCSNRRPIRLPPEILPMRSLTQ